jgi:phosphoribosylanthranilate isomerase
MTVRVKICGLTRFDDALSAAEAGADYLGFNHYARSPRCVEPERSAEIVAAVRLTYPAVQMVGVFVNENIDKIRFIMDTCGYGYAQFSGDEKPEDLHALAGRAFKAIRPVSTDQAEELAGRYANRAVQPALLLDAHAGGLYGGSGVRADLALAAELAQDWDLMLAGGLNPENVAEAVRLVRPWAVDVASGVEVSPGIKDHDKLRRFIVNAKSFPFEVTL